MTTSPDGAAASFIGAFVDELARSGVRHVCIAPGSRSTPLALIIAAHPSLRHWIHLDERSAGFFALGMARMLHEPVALLCTSGTAAANFFPAVVEARSAGIPLLVLTADRPPELRNVGAPQTIDQNRLYGEHAKWFAEVAIPEASADMLRYVRALACRATALARAEPAGPVHLDFPLREPLVPVVMPEPAGLSSLDLLAWHGRPHGAPWVAVHDAPPVTDARMLHALSARLRAARRPLFVCGPQHDLGLAAPLARLAALLGAPLLADPLSQVRWGPHDRSVAIDRYDAMLRYSTADAPDLVLRIGAPPTSKALQQYLQRHADVPQIVVDATRWPDPALVAADIVHADPRVLMDMLVAIIDDDRGAAAHAGDSAWLGTWRAMDVAAGAALTAHSRELVELFEGRVLAEVAALVPDGGTLFVSSSMPVRDLDAFAAGDARSLRVLSNRGANGIDGVVSTALGAAAASQEMKAGPLVLVIGDIAFYHDMNGLLAARLHALDATVVVINNDGGGIFSFLPQAELPQQFEALFGTPHGLQFEPVATLYGARYRRAEDWASLRDGVTEGVRGRGLHVVELSTDRARNVVLHRDAWASVGTALGHPLPGRQ